MKASSKISASDLTLPSTNAEAFLSYLDDWFVNLSPALVDQVFAGAARAALLSVDMTHGFCKSGALASPRVGALIPAVVSLMQAAWERGVRDILLFQDTHEPDAVEFSAWPPHCVRGTEEAEAVSEIKALPFYEQMLTLPKNSIDSGANDGLSGWLAAHPATDTFVVVGDCTDLCVYQLAMRLRTDANERQLKRRVIVPAAAVDTYDIPVDAAQAAGIFPHPGQLLHGLFLYHMALNGIEVVKAIA